MGINKQFIILIFLISGLFAPFIQAAISHDISLNWKTLKSKHVDVHFHQGEQALAEKTATIAEHWLIELQKDLQWELKDPVEIILSDEKDYANGFLSPLLTHLRITLYLTPPDASFDFDDWLTLLIKHELTHALHLDKVKNNPMWLKKILGRHPLLYPNLFQPLWLTEGYATYQETEVDKGIGRGQSSLFKMLMRMEVKNGLKPLEQVNLNISSWPAGSTRYLYGYYFYAFLEATYGKDSITHFIEAYSKNLMPYRLNKNATLIYGKNFRALWQDFMQYLNQKFKSEIDQISMKKFVAGEQITNSGYFKQFVQPLENGDVLYAEYDAINPPKLQLKKFKTKKIEVISKIQTETDVDLHPTSGILLSQIEIYRNTNAFYDLFHVNLKTKKMKRLTRGDRFRNATWNPAGDKILAVYNKLGRHSLVLLNKKGELIDLLWEGKEGEYIASIDWSPNSEALVASIKRNRNSWNLEEFNIAQRSWKSLTNNNATEMQPQYSHDGKFIYYSADYNGIFNIQKLDLDKQSISALTYVLGGAFSPRTNSKDALFYVGYGEKGYDVFHLKNSHPLKWEKQQFLKNKTTAISYKKTNFKIYDYSSFTHIAPTWWTPTLSGDLESTRLGAYTSGSDALNRHAYDAYVAFEFQSLSFSGTLNYSFDRWFPIFQAHLDTRGRKNSRLKTYQLEVLLPLFSRNQKTYIGVSVAYEKESKTRSDGRTDRLVGLGIIHDSRRRELQSISASHGRLLSIAAENSDIFGGDNNGQMLIAKWKEYINIGSQHVLALRFMGGFGSQTPRPFQLGGSLSDSEFQNASPFSALPLKTSLYNKRRYALRGYPADAKSLVGRRMVMYNIEWRFPLKLVERSLDMYPLGLQQISTALFAEAASVWNTGSSPQDYHQSFGAELHFHTEWFFFLPVQARLGYAFGFQEDGGHQLYFAFNSSF